MHDRIYMDMHTRLGLNQPQLAPLEPTTCILLTSIDPYSSMHRGRLMDRYVYVFLLLF